MEGGVRFLAATRDQTQEHNEENILELIASEADDQPGNDVVQTVDDKPEVTYDATLDLPNPGEIVEEGDSLVRDYVTKLNFVARYPLTKEEEERTLQRVISLKKFKTPSPLVLLLKRKTRTLLSEIAANIERRQE